MRLDLSALNSVQCYEPGDLTVRVQAGARVSTVLEVLAARGQMLPFDMHGWRRAHIGGVLASAAHGPLAASFGGVREYCIGIEFVTAEGKIAHGGGLVVKNVAGYDLMKLMIGSRGTHGIITSSSFKVFPRATHSTTFVIPFARSDQAVKLGLMIRKSQLSPSRLEIVSPGFMEVASWSLLVSATGSEAVVNRYRTELKACCESLTEFAGMDEAALWDQLLTSDEAAVYAELWSPLDAIQRTIDVLWRTFDGTMMLSGRLGIGNLNLWVRSEFGHVHSVLETLSSDVKVLWRSPRLPLALPNDGPMRTLKQALDPRNILNPGAVTL
ncbi:MAG: FAD-binding oxidoreductase [Acidobacteriaceae bacterium]